LRQVHGLGLVARVTDRQDGDEPGDERDDRDQGHLPLPLRHSRHHSSPPVDGISGYSTSGSNARSASLTSRDVTACSTNRARRLTASFPGPPRSPRTPRRSSLSQTLSSFRWNRVMVHPSRSAAALDDGISVTDDPSRRNSGS